MSKTLNLLQGEGGYKVIPGCAAVHHRGRIVDLSACTEEDAKELAARPGCTQVSHPDITAAEPAPRAVSNTVLPAPPPPRAPQDGDAAPAAATAKATTKGEEKTSEASATKTSKER